MPIYLSSAPVLGGTASLSSYSTSFPLTENPISESGKWVTGLANGLDWTDPQTSPAEAFGTQPLATPPPFNDSIGHLNATTFAGIGVRQWCQGTMVNNSASGSIECELLLMFSISSHSASGYEIDIINSGSLIHIVKWNGALNSFTDLTPSGISGGGAFTTGTILYAQIDQSGNISVYRGGSPGGGGSLLGSVTDTTYANISGRMPGMGFFRETGASASNTLGFSTWSAGNF